MSLKLRKSLITFLTALVLLVSSLAIFVAPNNFVKVNAAVTRAQIEGVGDSYIINAKETFPVSITDPIPAGDGVVIYPNGKVYKIEENKQFTLNVAGNYTLRYFGESEVVEKTFLVTQKNFVLSVEQEAAGKNEIVPITKEVMEGQLLPQGGADKYPEDYQFEKYDNSSAWPNIEQNLTPYGREALAVRMESGTKFTYSKPIDLTNANADGLTEIVKFDARFANYHRSKTGSSANYKIADGVARNLIITLTECYDSSRYMRLILQEGGDVNYARAGMDNMPETGWVFPASKQVTSDMSAREFYEGTQYGYAYVGKYGAGRPAGNENEWARRDALTLKFDYENAKVWLSSFDSTGTGDYKETMVSDFKHKGVYKDEEYRGFTTGEVYLSIEFGDYQSSAAARVDIYEIGGAKTDEIFEMRADDLSGDPTKLAIDNKAPVIKSDFMATINDGVYVDVGSYFTVPAAQAFDINLMVDMNVMAYRNYVDTAHKINVPIVDGKLLISEADIYTIVYTAEDSYGNVTEKCVKVFGVKDDNNPAVEFDYGTELANLDAGRTYALPKFTFNTRNIADSRKLNITISSDKESIVLANLSGSAQIEEFLAQDVEFMLNYAGEYTIEYTYSDNAIAQVVSYKVTCNASDVVSFSDKPFLQRYLIKNATYDFDEIYTYSYVTGSKQPYQPAEIFIAYDADINQANIADSTFTKLDSAYSNKITGSEKAVLKYQYGEYVAYSDIATIVDVGMEKLATLKQYKYFTGDFATAHPNDESYDEELFDQDVYYPIVDEETGKRNFDSSKLDYKSMAKSGNNTLSFINMIDITNFSFYYRIINSMDPREDADNFNGLRLVFTDPYNAENQVYARLYKLPEGGVFFDLNGEKSGAVTQDFSGAIDKSFTYNKSLGLFTVSGLSTKFAFDFDFTTTRAYLDIVFEDISGVAGIRVLELNAHKFSHDGRARTTPTALMTIPQGNYATGSIITINPAEFVDVLSPIVKEKISLSVVGPDGNFLVALDGTVLDTDCDPYKSYQVELTDLGQYKVSYSAVSGINQKSNPPGFVFVVDLVKPEITYKGDIYEGCVLYLKPGQVYNVKYSITDDVSLSENIFSRIVWTNRATSVGGLFFDNDIYFIKEGVYEVGVSCMDEQYNFARKTFTVIVTNEEVK